MADQISYKIDVDVAGQLSVTVKESFAVEAYAKIETSVQAAEDDDNPGTITLRPLPGMGAEDDQDSRIGFFMVTSTLYDEGIKLEAKDSGDQILTLSEPIASFGTNAVSRLGLPNGQLELVNETDRVVSVQVLVGWDAIVNEEEE